MNWLYFIPLTGPIFFYCWFQWTYRWDNFDAGPVPFWKRFLYDLRLSMPGRQCDEFRGEEVSKIVRKYAEKESPHSVVSVYGVDEPFQDIIRDGRYAEYSGIFLRPKWTIWAMILSSMVWPVVILLWIVLYVVVSLSKS